MMKNL